MISVESLVTARTPQPKNRFGRFFQHSLIAGLRRLFYERQINQFLEDNAGADGFEFIDRVLEYFRFSYRCAHLDRERIPASGRVVIVANHPLGGLDALALLHLIGQVRPDVKIVANDVLWAFAPLRSLLLPVDNMGGRVGRREVTAIRAALEQEQAVVVFPAGEVSRVRPTGVRDTRWHSGFLRFAKASDAPILPVHLGGSNSPLFYSVSMLNKAMAGLLLAHEMFKQSGGVIDIRVGASLSQAQLDLPGLSRGGKVDLIKRHLYRIASGRPPLLEGERPIAHPESRSTIAAELSQARLLGHTVDGKEICLYRYRSNDALMREIGRLREHTFRAVGEGTGRRRDLDRYDRDYQHIVLWDRAQLEVVGSYRLTPASDSQGRRNALYCDQLFSFDVDCEFFDRGVELGRSFVQPRFWGSRSLDYLWYGIGAYLSENPQYRYLFGTVSISGRLPEPAKQMLVYFYRRFMPAHRFRASARNPFPIPSEQVLAFNDLFDAEDYQGNFRILKKQLALLGVAVPTLYKQYGELCEPGGVEFLDFGVDPDFAFCVDGLVVVDLDQLKARKRARYFPKPARSVA